MNSLGFNIGLLIGVRSANFAHAILRHWHVCEKFYLVDPYQHIPILHADELMTDTISDPEQMFQDAVSRMSVFGNVPSWLRLTPQQAITHIPDNSIDFIYIDDRHDYCSVMQNLELFWPKLRVGGVMAGHDYLTVAEAKKLYERFSLKIPLDWSVCEDGTRNEGAVKGAVLEFSRRTMQEVRTVYFTSEPPMEPGWNSWAMWKERGVPFDKVCALGTKILPTLLPLTRLHAGHQDVH